MYPLLLGFAINAITVRLKLKFYKGRRPTPNVPILALLLQEISMTKYLSTDLVGLRVFTDVSSRIFEKRQKLFLKDCWKFIAHFTLVARMTDRKKQKAKRIYQHTFMIRQKHCWQCTWCTCWIISVRWYLQFRFCIFGSAVPVDEYAVCDKLSTVFKI